MSEENYEVETEEVVDSQLDEFKASMGDPSEVPEPTSAKAKKRKGDKDQSEPQADQGSSKTATPGDSGAAPEAKATVKTPKTKAGMVNAMVKEMQGMSTADLEAKFGKLASALSEDEVAEETESEDTITLKSDQGLRVGAEDLDIAEDVAAMFSGEDLSEDFVSKATTIFEAAIVSKINETLEKVTVDVETEITEAKEEMAAQMETKLDDYLEYVVEGWMKENELAVDSGIRSTIATEFMEGLKDLFTEHYIDIPEEKVDVAEELAAKVDEYEASLNSQIEENIELKKQLQGHVATVIVSTDVKSKLSKNLTSPVRALTQA
jgi:methyltransferase-like protein